MGNCMSNENKKKADNNKNGLKRVPTINKNRTQSQGNPKIEKGKVEEAKNSKNNNNKSSSAKKIDKKHKDQPGDKENKKDEFQKEPVINKKQFAEDLEDDQKEKAKQKAQNSGKSQAEKHSKNRDNSLSSEQISLKNQKAQELQAKKANNSRVNASTNSESKVLNKFPRGDKNNSQRDISSFQANPVIQEENKVNRINEPNKIQSKDNSRIHSNLPSQRTGKKSGGAPKPMNTDVKINEIRLIAKDIDDDDEDQYYSEREESEVSIDFSEEKHKAKMVINQFNQEQAKPRPHFDTYKFSFVGDDYELEQTIKQSDTVKETFQQNHEALELLGNYFKNNVAGDMQNYVMQFEQLLEIWQSNKPIVEFFAERIKFRANKRMHPDNLITLTMDLKQYTTADSLDYANKIKSKFGTAIRTKEELSYLKTSTGIFLYELKNLQKMDDLNVLFDAFKDKSLITYSIQLEKNKATNILDILGEIHSIDAQKLIIEKLAKMKISMKSMYNQLNELVRNENFEILVSIIDVYASENTVDEYERLLGSHLTAARGTFLSGLFSDGKKKIEKKHNEVFERLLYNLTEENSPPNLFGSHNGTMKKNVKKFVKLVFKQHFTQMIESSAVTDKSLKQLDRTEKQVDLFKLGFLRFAFLNELFQSLCLCLSQIVKYLDDFWGNGVYDRFIEFIDDKIRINIYCIKQYQLLKEPCHYIAGIINFISLDKMKVDEDMKGIKINEVYYRYLRVLLALTKDSEDDIKRFFIECRDKYSETYSLDWLLKLLEVRMYEIKYSDVAQISISDLLQTFSILESFMQQYLNSQSAQQVQEITTQIVIHTQPLSWNESLKGMDQVMFFLKYQKYDDVNQTYNELLTRLREDQVQQKAIITKAKGIYHTSFFKDNFDQLIARANEIDPQDVLNDKYNFSGAAALLKDLMEVVKIFMIRMKDQYKMLVLPHHVQIISVLESILCIMDKKNAIFQIGTGEGKSLVIAMLASFLIKTKKAKRIHIMIGNVALIERDYNTFSKAYEDLGIVSSTSLISSQYVKDHQIYYCTVEAMRQMNYYVKDTDRLDMYTDTILLVDEVDNIIIDSDINNSYVFVDERRTQQLYQYFHAKQQGQSHFHGLSSDLLKEFNTAYDLAVSEKNIGKEYFLHQGQYRAFDKILAQPTNTYTLELELINYIKFKKDMRYLSAKYISSLPYIVQRHSRLIGFSGSIGSKFERQFVEKLYSTLFFKIPPFLNCCKGQKPKETAKLKEVIVEKNELAQFKKIWMLAKQHSKKVPVLVIMADDKGVEDIIKIEKDCAKVIEITFSKYEKSLNSLSTLIRTSTEKWGQYEFRITYTSPFGARGQDYRPIDPIIEENGGMMVILSHIPPSKREYIQFLGRVGRQDKKGQFYAVLNEEECIKKHPNANLNLRGDLLIKELLKAGQNEIKAKLDSQQDDMEKGIVMNHYSDEIIQKVGRIQDFNSDKWAAMVKNYKEMTINQIKEAYQKVQQDFRQQNQYGYGGDGGNY